jgi:predicted transcriptional regulator with HTH domain
MYYQIVVRGQSRTTLTGALEGMSVRFDGGNSVITGDIVDQSQLLGAVEWLADRGIQIVSVTPLDVPPGVPR